MGRVTYVHHYVRTSFLCIRGSVADPAHQLPTLYFSVLMVAHLLDHFIFSSQRYTQRTKSIVFGLCAVAVVANFWWFRGLAFGVDGPIKDYTGLQWRKVSIFAIESPKTAGLTYLTDLEHIRTSSSIIVVSYRLKMSPSNAEVSYRS